MSSKSQRRKLVRLQRDEAALRDDLADRSRDEGKARKKAAKERGNADRASSPVAQRSALRRAEAAEKKASKAAGNAADVSKKIAANADNQRGTRDRIDTTERSERRQTDRVEDRRDAQRRRRELAHARAVARAEQPPRPLPDPEPSVLRVLYLTANPEATEREITYPDGTHVREGSGCASMPRSHRSAALCAARATATRSNSIIGRPPRPTICSTGSTTCGLTPCTSPATPTPPACSWTTAARTNPKAST